MKNNLKLSLVAFLIIGFSVTSCKKENGGPITNEPVNLLQQKWNSDSIDFKLSISGQLIIDSSETFPAGSYLYFFSDTQAEKYNPDSNPQRDTFNYVNLDNKKLVSVYSGTADTADIVTLTESSLVLNNSQNRDTFGVPIEIDINFYLSR